MIAGIVASVVGGGGTPTGIDAIFVGAASYIHVGDGSTTPALDMTALTGGIASAPSADDVVIVSWSRATAGTPGTASFPAGFYLIANTTGSDAADTRLMTAGKIMGSTPDTSLSFGTPASGTGA